MWNVLFYIIGNSDGIPYDMKKSSITSKQTTMTALIASTFVLNTFIYMYVCYASAVYVPEMWPTSAKLSISRLCNAMGRVSKILFQF